MANNVSHIYEVLNLALLFIMAFVEVYRDWCEF